ncbi:TFIIB-type zinc ribbon-containing protein [Saccharothrix syringae]|uniref:Transcriptional regulator n=1 Tax=Saccharothrix syringae TaxID=103733 RepID=A0A5Q0HBJ6_SACSY|nr:zf-TFIIB domain-containing protein [Saccharothrix syringae]QFZ23628.1 transcriptional regulator [Saccharothrix syringae]
MICPKCQDLMQTITRGSVHIEQCENCHGVFLDGGELEQIIAAERAHYAPPYRPEGAPVTAVVERAPEQDGDQAPAGQPVVQPVAPPAAGPPPPYQPPPYQPPPAYQAPPGTPPPPPAHPGYHDPYYGHRRRRSFLEELFD